MNTTLCPVARWGREAPERIALKTQSETISYAEWDEQIGTYVTALAKHGVGADQRVALCLECSVDYLTVLMALFRLGAVACPINPAFPDAYRTARLKRLNCHHRIVDGEIPVGKSCIPVEGLFEETCPAATATAWKLDTPATIIFTSGSTGEPKAAVLSLGNHLSNAKASNANIPLEAGDVWLLSLPLHHVAGLGILFRCIQAGATIGIPGTDELLEEAAEALGATHFSLVARQLARLLDSPTGTAVLSRAKGILLGGSAVPAALLASAHKRGLPIHTTYGMTEMATQVTTTPLGVGLETLCTSGQPLVSGTVRIGASLFESDHKNQDNSSSFPRTWESRTQTGKPETALDPHVRGDDGLRSKVAGDTHSGGTGIIKVNGPCRFLGYWEHGALRAPFDGEGWFTTSDLGYLDDLGNLHVTGRADNMFVSGGENIQPECVEHALCNIDGITQAVVVPIPHPEFGATPVAFVADAKGHTLAQIQEELQGILPDYQLPRHLLPWPNALAHEGMKIDRAAFTREAKGVGLSSPT